MAKARSQGPHGHAAKAKACSPPWPRSQGQGMQPAPHGHAAKAKACSPPWARSQGHKACSLPWACSSQGQGSSPPRQQPPMARSQGQQGKPPWACCQGGLHGQAAKDKATGPPWHAAKAKACRQPLWARCQGNACSSQGSPHGHDAKARARSQGMQRRPKGEGTRGVSLRRARGKELIFFLGGVILREEGGTNRSDTGLNLSGSWQQGHSATYNTPSRI